MQESKLDRTQRAWRLLLGVAAISALFALKWINPESGGLLSSEPMVQRVFGLPCPFCGMTRGTHALMNADLARMWYLNMATLPVILVGVFTAVIWIIESARGVVVARWESCMQWALKHWWLGAVLFFGFWVLHLALALMTPKPELLQPEALLFPG